MPEKIWEKFEKLKTIDDKNFDENFVIKTYLTRIQPIVKEIKAKDKYDYILISQRIEKLKHKIKIYDIIEENDIIYIVLDNNEELNNKVDELLFSEKLDIKKEVITEGHGAPIKKNEIFELFKMEKSMCKIENINKNGERQTGSGFFCKLNDNMISFKYALFTNNHVLDESSIDIGKKIQFEFFELKKSMFNTSYNLIKKEIEITEERKVYTNEELDYTCIELFESDGIKDFFEIEPDLFKYDINNILKDNDIFILQFPKGNDLYFSHGIIKSIKDNIIEHNASTEEGSSGSPIIRRTGKNYVIGLHFGGGIKNKNKDKYLYNLATDFVSIIDDIKKQEISEINCIYIADKDKKEINLLHDYSANIQKWTKYYKELYMEAKKNKSIFEKNIDLYINEEKINFVFKYKMKELKEIKVKFKFNKNLIKNTSYMFFECFSLKSIDLSSFNTRNINNMSSMFSCCYNLQSIDLSSFNKNNANNMNKMFSCCNSLRSIDLSTFNTSEVKDMSWMFSSCSSLESIDLTSFNTSKTKDMHSMFYRCSSLKSIDLSSFDTSNAQDMNHMFSECDSLESIDLSSFRGSNVKDMGGMLRRCSSLKSINLSSFNTSNVQDMNHMFSLCSSLESIDLTSFNTSNVRNMKCMFYDCSSLISIDLSSFNASNVKDMSSMFCDCSSLISIDLSSFNASNIKNMDHMFSGCSSLESIKFSLFYTSNVKDMTSMFEDCSSLKSIDLSSFNNTGNVKTMFGMFSRCSSLELIDLSSFNTSNVINMGYMFNKCSSLKSIDLSKFNTSQTEDMSCMFCECSSLSKDNIKINNREDKIIKYFEESKSYLEFKYF